MPSASGTQHHPQPDETTDPDPGAAQCQLTRCQLTRC